MNARAVFLDRDGTLNRATIRAGRSYPPDRVEDFELLPGVIEGLAALRAAGFVLIVVTNQPDVAAGRQSRSVVERMHERLRALTPVDDVRVCYHDDAAGCTCRKPQPGMLLAAATDHAIDLSRSYMIGDRWRDVEAGRAAGCRTVFIASGYAERQPDSPDLTVATVLEASAAILSGRL